MTPAQLLRHAASALLYATGHYGRKWRRREREISGLVAVYHRIAPSGSEASGYGVERGLPVGHFEAHLRFLRRYFEPARAADLAAPGGPGRLQFAVTFDDGYEDTLSVAAPVLERLGIPATVFVNSDFVGTDRLFWWESLTSILDDSSEETLPPREVFPDLDGPLADALPLRDREERARAHALLSQVFMRLPASQVDPSLERLAALTGVPVRREGRPTPLLGWDDLRVLQKRGFDVGAHATTHANLGPISESEVGPEILQCVERIASELGPVELFAYPYGGSENRSPRAAQAIAAAGCVGAFTTDAGAVRPDSDRFALPRIGLGRPLSFLCAARADAAFDKGVVQAA